MNENLELLEYISESSSMGVATLTDLLKELDGKENKLKSLISDELSEYEKYSKKVKELLENMDTKAKDSSKMRKMMAKKGIEKEVKEDNSDAAISHMLIEGFTMGVVDIETKIKNFDDKVDKDVQKLAKEYLKFQQNEIEKLKKYL